MDAYPAPDNFKWSFNNSASENILVPEERFPKEKQSRSSHRNLLKYTPMSEMDYGTLICSATNMAGTQLEPCVYMIIAAGKVSTNIVFASLPVPPGLSYDNLFAYEIHKIHSQAVS